MAAVSIGVLYNCLAYAKVLGQRTLQTGRIEGGQGGYLVGLQARVYQCNEARDVGRVKDYHAELGIGTIFLDVFAQALRLP